MSIPTDTEIMDWLEKQTPHIFYSKIMKRFSVSLPDITIKGSIGKNLREAITKAMEINK